jgi:tetratricopeptide (TPR) repeat protein
MVGAITPLQRAHELYPEHHDTLRNYVEAMVALPDDAADPERLLRVSAELLDRSPDDPWIRTLVVQGHLQAGRLGGDLDHYQRAEEIALSCLTIATPKGYVYQLAAYARHGLNDVEGALRHLDTSIARGLNTVDVQIDRARLLHELGRISEAKKAIMNLQREWPTDTRVLSALRYFAAPGR